MIKPATEFIDPSSEINELSPLQRMRGADLTTDSMKRRNALKAQSIAAASKANWAPTDLPIQPAEFGNTMTDMGLYC